MNVRPNREASEPFHGNWNAARTARPRRIQLSRTKGWRMPPNTVKVDRSTRHGNPFTVAEYGDKLAVFNYRLWMIGQLAIGAKDVSSLRGKNLACWCKPGAPCHADVLLVLANAESNRG